MESIKENPLFKLANARKREQIVERFPELSGEDDNIFLSTHRYIVRCPHRFYDHEIYRNYLEYLNQLYSTENGRLRTYLSENLAEIDRGFLHLEEINELDWHDKAPAREEYELIRFIDQKVHGTYLRLIEGVLTPFCRLVAFFSRIRRGKGTDGLDIWSIAQELARTELAEAVYCYRNTVRNAIAHGGITYLQKEILYQDNKGKRENHGDTEVIRLTDDLLDSCNAMALAFSVFSIKARRRGLNLPRQLLISELKEVTRAPWWEVVGCTPSMFNHLNQLVIYAKPGPPDTGKIQLSAFQTGILSEQFAPGYDRYFVSIRSSNCYPGWAAFNGKALQELRERGNASLADYKGVIENNLIFYKSYYWFPVLLSKVYSWILTAKLAREEVSNHFQKNLSRPNIRVRNAKIHRNAWGTVLHSDIVISAPRVDLDQDYVRQHIRRIIKTSLRSARSRARRLDVSRYLPLGYAEISVFCKDFRARRLRGFGLGKSLICTIRVKRISRIKVVHILNSELEQRGSLSVYWNNAWLEESSIE